LKYTYIAILLALGLVTPLKSAQEGKHLFILSGQSNMVGLKLDVSFTCEAHPPAAKRTRSQGLTERSNSTRTLTRTLNRHPYSDNPSFQRWPKARLMQLHQATTVDPQILRKTH